MFAMIFCSFCQEFSNIKSRKTIQVQTSNCITYFAFSIRRVLWQSSLIFDTGSIQTSSSNTIMFDNF